MKRNFQISQNMRTELIKNRDNKIRLQNNKIRLENSLKIDIIFPYVDCEDPEWQKLYYENLVKYNKVDQNWDDWATGMKRFRPNGMLKYVFRSIEKNCSWINKVHMIVQSESQIPEWINREQINIVYHKDFIPEEYLPTFNSSVIEMFLQNIEDLSEYFIYGNDDMFFTSPINVNDFFVIKKASLYQNKYHIKKLAFGAVLRKINSNWTGDILRESNHKLLTRGSRKYIYAIQHTYLPHKKSTIKNVFERYKTEIINNLTPFRNPNEHNQWLFSEYYIRNNMHTNNKLKFFSTEINSNTISRILNKDFSKYKAICLNDHANTTNEQIEQVISKLDELFPEKSKYEL